MYLLYHTSKDKKKQFHKKNNFKLRYSLCFVLTMAILDCIVADIQTFSKMILSGV